MSSRESDFERMMRIARTPIPDNGRPPLQHSVLADLTTLKAQQERIEELLLLRVRQARAVGASWQRIGTALGTSRQAAWERFEQFDDPELLNGKPR